MGASFRYATVSVADMDAALAMWRDAFGMTILQREPAAFSADVVEEAFLGLPEQTVGLIHLVQFAHPGEAVRAGAATTDFCPKNLDLYCRNLPEIYDRLGRAGYEFRAKWSEYQVEDRTVREVQLLGHDCTNIGLMELGTMPENFSPTQFSGLGPVVCTVPDADAECGFYRDLFGLDTVIHKYLDGVEIERMIGLPEGAGLDMRVLGSHEQMLGRVEIIEYRGADGVNRYPIARAPATGTLSLTFSLEDLAMPIEQVAQRYVVEAGGTDLELVTPAGMLVRLE